MIRISEIDSLTNFQKNVKAIVGRLAESKKPLVLTVNGKAKIVVQDASAYQAILDELERARFIEAVKVGLNEASQGLGRPAEEAFAEMKAKYDL